MFDYQTVFILAVPTYFIWLFFQIWKKEGFRTIFIQSIFFFYVTALLSATFFPLPFQKLALQFGREDDFLSNNFVLFRTLFAVFSTGSVAIIRRQILGNIALLLPLGFFLPLLGFKDYRLVSAFRVGFVTSFAIEIAQLFISFILGFTYKITDVDDVILNTLGCVLGYFLFKVFMIGNENQQVNQRRKEI